MTKTIVVPDKVFDWLTRRAGSNKSVALVLTETIAAIDRLESDLIKYQLWVDGSTRIPPPDPPAPLPEGG